VTVASQPVSTPASATDSLAGIAAAALADLEDLPAGRPALARSSRPASPAERRDAIVHAWRDEPGISDTALVERFGVSRRTIQRDIQALQERGIQRHVADRRRRSHRTRAHYAAIYRRFLAWLADELGRPPILDDLSGEVLASLIAPAGERRRSRWRGIIIGVTAAGMERPASTCPLRRPARAGRQPVRRAWAAQGRQAGNRRDQSASPGPAARGAGRDPSASALSICAASLLGDSGGQPGDHGGPAAGSGWVAGRHSAQAYFQRPPAERALGRQR
jgi:hypothetical protein